MNLFKDIDIKGQNQNLVLLKKMFPKKLSGRTVIFSGPKGVGKWTTALSLSGGLFSTSPFDSPDFSFYRNDAYFLKTSYYLSHYSGSSLSPSALRYFLSLCARYARAISLGEMTKSEQELMLEIENTLKQYGAFPEKDKIREKWKKTLFSVSENLEKKQRFPIDFIRQMINEHKLKPNGEYKVTILADFDKASIEAQNAALKIFEEPPQSSILILTAENTGHLLPTILSRSLIFHFRPLNKELVSEILNDSENSANSIPEAMKENLYHYSQQSRELVFRFFQSIAPGVQHHFELFTFIDELNSDSHPELVLFFLSALSNFFLNLLRKRQSVIRQHQIFEESTYATLYEPLHVYTAELKEISSMISESYFLIKNRNMKAKLLLPDLLLNISRWYQIRKQY